VWIENPLFRYRCPHLHTVVDLDTGEVAS
jgi:hypothetical protein